MKAWYDRMYRPILPGDVIRTQYKRSKCGTKMYFCHLVVERDDALWVAVWEYNDGKPYFRTAAPIEKCGWIVDDVLTKTEIIQGFGPEPYEDFLERPMKEGYKPGYAKRQKRTL